MSYGMGLYSKKINRKESAGRGGAMTRNNPTIGRIMRVNSMQVKKNFIALIALVIMIGILSTPFASAASTYYITSKYTQGTYGAGQVLGPDYIAGAPDSYFATIRGVSSAGDGGYIIGNTATISYPSSFEIRAFTGTGYNCKVHVYVSYNSNGPLV